MSGKRLQSLEHIRAVSMLGVIAIHTGAYYLSNPHLFMPLFVSLEIASRFSIPAFFFVSAFGLFFKADRQTFSYRAFLARRLPAVLVPYLAWSLIYRLYYGYVTHDWTVFSAKKMLISLVFGLSSYHLYFIVILILFYLCMPLLRPLVFFADRHPRLVLPCLLLGQIAVNYWSSYLRPVIPGQGWTAMLVNYLPNYWPVHYLLIFVAGAVFALNYQRWSAALRRHAGWVILAFVASLIIIVAAFLHCISNLGYSPQSGVDTIHQLSPPGVIYSLSACFFFWLIFEFFLPAPAAAPLSAMARLSYPVYLCHPLVMYCLYSVYARSGIIFTVGHTLLFFIITVVISMSLGRLITGLPPCLAPVRRMLAGTK
ncbi:MAG: acyltransferase [Negativicutes bacterium]|nr:acyltransferase [Negativicutes bacterium]